MVLAFGIEPLIYGTSLNEWSDLQAIVHWIVTCALWGAVSFGIVRLANKKYGFDLFQRGNKVIKEFYANGPVRFVFQYIYYIFETILVTLILIFGQKAFEKWFHRENIPYGGIIVSISWGLGHFFTKDIWTGIVCMISGLAFGSVYLLVNRDIRKAFPILWIMFVL